MSSTKDSDLGFERPAGHPEGDASQCPFLFLKLMQMKARANPQYGTSHSLNDPHRPAPPLIINSSSSGEEEYTSDDSDSSEADLPAVLGTNSPSVPQRTNFPPVANPWYDPDLEKLLDEAFPMTDEEKAEAGSLMCPTMIFQRMAGIKVLLCLFGAKHLRASLCLSLGKVALT